MQKEIREKYAEVANWMGVLGIAGATAMFARYLNGCGGSVLLCRVPYQYGSPHVLVWFGVAALGFYASFASGRVRGMIGVVAVVFVLNYHEALFNIWFNYLYPDNMVAWVKYPVVFLLTASNFVVLLIFWHYGVIKKFFDMKRLIVGTFFWNVLFWLWVLAGFQITVMGNVPTGRTFWYYNLPSNMMEIVMWHVMVLVVGVSLKIESGGFERLRSWFLESTPRISVRRSFGEKGRLGFEGKNRIEGSAQRGASAARHASSEERSD